MGKCENVIYLELTLGNANTAPLESQPSRGAAREWGLAFGFGEGMDSVSKKLGTAPPLQDAPA